MERVARLNDPPVEAVYGRADALYFHLSGVAEGGVLVVEDSVRRERVVVVQHVVGGAGVSAAVRERNCM